MSGRRSRQKGARAERECVALLRGVGLNAYRIPLSGSCAGFKSDVEIRLPTRTLKVESKIRAGGFSTIYRWLDGSDVLVLRRDRDRLLAVISLEELARLLAANAACTCSKQG